MAHYRNKKRKLMAEINVVPYIDVMLVLLIIFMVTAPMLQQGIEVDLPRTSSAPVPPSQLEPIILSVDKNGLYYLNIGESPDKPITVDVVQKQVGIVLRNKPSTPVLVKGDSHVNYGHVVNAMAFLQAAGAAKVGLITELPDNVSPNRND